MSDALYWPSIKVGIKFKILLGWAVFFGSAPS